MSGPVEIFFSYAHEDEALMNHVRRHLVIFDRLGEIKKWHDRQIPAGADWKGQIDVRLRSARIILLFVTPDFFESDYCFDVEMQEALRRHAAHEATVIPIIARPCAWRTAPFGMLQVLPTDGKPLTSWANLDDACLNVAEGVMSVARRLHPAELTSASGTPPTPTFGATGPQTEARGLGGNHPYDWSSDLRAPSDVLAVGTTILYEEHSDDPSYDRASYERNKQLIISSKPFRSSRRGFVKLHSHDFEWLDPRDPDRRIVEGRVEEVLEDGRVLMDVKYGRPLYLSHIVDVLED